MKKSKTERLKKFKTSIPSPSIKCESTNDLHPAFCFEFNTYKNYTVRDLELSNKASFLHRLHDLCQLSWGKIQIAPREGLGHEKLRVASLKRKLNLPKELKEVLVFRFENGRIIGFRKGQTFYIAAIDTRYDCYDH